MPTTATFDCCWCQTSTNAETGNTAHGGHIICDPCWDAGDDGYTPDCNERCREDAA